MDIHQLRVFVSVFKNRSFSKASVELGLTQPTVSDHIRHLEEELSATLFDRTGRRIIPTPEAGVLYGRALEVIERFEVMKNALSDLKDEVKGELIIGASTIPGTYILPALAANFRDTQPQVSFQILIEDSRRITEMVMGHELLLGVVGAKMNRGQAHYEPIAEDELVLAVPKGMLKKKTITPAELAELPFILREEGSGTRAAMAEQLGENGIALSDLNVTAVLGSSAAVKEAVKSGLGASIISNLCVEEEARSGSVAIVKIRGISMKRKFYLLSHKKRTLPSHYRAFAEYLTRIAR